MRCEIRLAASGVTKRDVPVQSLVRRAARALRLPSEATVSIAVVPDSVTRTLNRRYRGKDTVASVLAFSLNNRDGAHLPVGHGLWGEIIIAHPRYRREAAAEGLSASQKIRSLVVHGLLHLAGFDHRREKDFRQMQRWEKRLQR